MSVAPHIPHGRLMSSARRAHGSALARPLPRPRPRPASESMRPRRLRDIHDRTVFEAVLHHERNRADRDDNDFSLVLLKVRANDTRTAKRLARAVIRRLRAIDEVGWYAQGCLCVLLPNTDHDGGQIFESNVRRLAEDSRINIVSRVYTYPSQWQIDSTVASS